MNDAAALEASNDLRADVSEEGVPQGCPKPSTLHPEAFFSDLW